MKKIKILRNRDGTFTKSGAKLFGFKKGNSLGSKTGGKNHWNWQGGYKMVPSRKTTYRSIKVDGKYRFEHRVIMEKFIGRKLLISEAVHHKDGNGLNNNIENLQLMSWAEHKRKHLGSYKYPNFECGCGNKKHFAKGLCKKCYFHHSYLLQQSNYKSLYKTL